jgi:hypothetical protein
LVLDETYKDFRATTAPAHGLFARSDWRDTLVHLYSFSKMLSLAGYRAGSLVAAPHVLREAAKLADCETISTPRVAQEAVAFGVTSLGDWVEARRVEMAARVAELDTLMAARPGAYEVVTSGAFFAYVRHPFASSRPIRSRGGSRSSTSSSRFPARRSVPSRSATSVWRSATSTSTGSRRRSHGSRVRGYERSKHLVVVLSEPRRRVVSTSRRRRTPPYN